MIKEIYPFNNFNERIRSDFLKENDISILENACISEFGTIQAENRLSDKLFKNFSSINCHSFFLFKPINNIKNNSYNWIILFIDNNNVLNAIYFSNYTYIEQISFNNITFSGNVDFAIMNNTVFIASQNNNYLFKLYIENDEIVLKENFIANPEKLILFSASGADNAFTFNSEIDTGMSIKAGSILQYIYTSVSFDLIESNPSPISTNNKMTFIRHNTIWQKNKLQFPPLDDKIKHYNLYRRDNLFSESDAISNFSLIAQVRDIIFEDNLPGINYVSPSYENDFNVSGNCLCVSNQKLFVGNAVKKKLFPNNYKKYKRIDVYNQDNKNLTDTWIKITISDLLIDTDLLTNNKIRFYDTDRTTFLKILYDSNNFYVNIPYVTALQTHFIFFCFDTEDILNNNFNYGFPVNINSPVLSNEMLPFQHNKNADTMFNWSGQWWENLNTPNNFNLVNIADYTGENITYLPVTDIYYPLDYEDKNFYSYFSNQSNYTNKKFFKIQQNANYTYMGLVINNIVKGSLKFQCIKTDENYSAIFNLFIYPQINHQYNIFLEKRDGSLYINDFDTGISLNLNINFNVYINYSINISNNKINYTVYVQYFNNAIPIIDTIHNNFITLDSNINYENLDEFPKAVCRFYKDCSYSNVYLEKNLLLNNTSDIQDFLNNLPIFNYSLNINIEKETIDSQKKYLYYSDPSGKYFPDSNMILQSDEIVKLCNDTNLKDNRTSGIYIFYKNKISHLELMLESGKTETIINDKNSFNQYNRNSVFEYNGNIFYIDNELKDIKGNVLSLKINKTRLNRNNYLSIDPANSRLAFSNENDIIFYDFKNENFNIYKTHSKINELLPINNELLVIGDNIKTFTSENSSRQLFSKFASKLFKTNNKIKIIKIMIKGKEQNGIIPEISIAGKLKNNGIEHEFEKMNIWHFLKNNNVFSEFKIYINHFENIESILIDIIERS